MNFYSSSDLPPVDSTDVLNIGDASLDAFIIEPYQ